MADISASGQIAQSAAPGALLRTTAEAQQTDPSKVNADAAVNSPIRNLTQNPLQSVIPSDTPRVLNVVSPQSPSVDYAGLHSMLANTPVPPAHIAAGLIRALMTPSSGVIQPKAYVPAPSMPGAPAAPNAPQQANAAPHGVSQPNISPASPNYAPRAMTPNHPVFQQNFGTPQGFATQNRGQAYNYGPAQQQHSAPQTHQNIIGNHAFIPGTIGGAGLLGGLRSALGSAGNFLGNIGSRFGAFQESALPFEEELAAFL